MSGYFIIVDFGSSSVKTFLLSEKGKIKFEARRDISPSYSEKKVEYEPETTFSAFSETLESAIKAAGGAKRIISVGIACQRSTFLIWDKISGVPLTPIISWQDGRAGEMLKKIKINDSLLHSITGLYKTPYYSAPKIKFCADNDKKIKKAFKEKRALVGPVASYVLWRISAGSIFVADPTLAQRTLLFNIKTMKWDDRLLKIFKVPAGALPELIPTFPENLKINFKGSELRLGGIIGDQQASVLPFVSNKSVVVNYGTGAFVLAGTGEKIVRIRGLLNSVAFTDEKKRVYLLESTVNSCGTFFQWLNLKFKLNIKAEDADSIIKKSKERIFVLPSIGGIGSPYWDYETLTTFSGFTPSTETADLVKSAVEGIAFFINIGLKLIKKRRPVKSLIASGGLSKMEYLLKFQSDITGLELECFGEPEATVFGLGGELAVRNGYSVKSWKAFSLDRKYSPRMKKSEREKLFGKWKYFFNSMRKIYKKKK